MTENVDEILDDSDRVLTEEDIDGGVLLRDLLLESVSEVVGERILYGGDEHMDEALIRIKRGAMSTAESVNAVASVMENFSKSGQSVADWDGDSLTTMFLEPTYTTEEPVRPKKRGERCSFCSNMKKKELKKHDSCPSCGRSLFALKSRGW